MKLGLIGYGTVGKALGDWFKKHTQHELAIYDEAKGFADESILKECSAYFISVPVPAGHSGQDTSILKAAVNTAKKYFNNKPIFIRSTILPGTADSFNCIAMPEFLTERFADQDMEKLPIIVGSQESFQLSEYKALLHDIFPNKKVTIYTNKETELAKFTHNCFGALKVTYFNMINNIAKQIGADFEQVKKAAFITGFIEKQHTSVPGPDGKLGYGGKCLPENIEALKRFCMYSNLNLSIESKLLNQVSDLNNKYRFNESSEV